MFIMCCCPQFGPGGSQDISSLHCEGKERNSSISERFSGTCSKVSSLCADTYTTVTTSHVMFCIRIPFFGRVLIEQAVIFFFVNFVGHTQKVSLPKSIAVKTHTLLNSQSELNT